MYVNYGRIEDYDRLTKELDVNVSGSIAIARYGRIFRGDKVHLVALLIVIMSSLSANHIATRQR